MTHPFGCGICWFELDEIGGFQAHISRACPEHTLIAVEQQLFMSLGWTPADLIPEPEPAPPWAQSLRWSCPKPGAR